VRTLDIKFESKKKRMLDGDMKREHSTYNKTIYKFNSDGTIKNKTTNGLYSSNKKEEIKQAFEQMKSLTIIMKQEQSAREITEQKIKLKQEDMITNQKQAQNKNLWQSKEEKLSSQIRKEKQSGQQSQGQNILSQED